MLHYQYNKQQPNNNEVIMYFVQCESEPMGTHTINHWTEVSDNPLMTQIATMREKKFINKFGDPTVNDERSDGWGCHWYWYTPQGNCLGIAFRYGDVRIRATNPSQSDITLFLNFIFKKYYRNN